MWFNSEKKCMKRKSLTILTQRTFHVDFHLYCLTKAVEPSCKNSDVDSATRVFWVLLLLSLLSFLKVVQQLLWGNINGNPYKKSSFVLKLLNFSSFMHFLFIFYYINFLQRLQIFKIYTADFPQTFSKVNLGMIWDTMAWPQHFFLHIFLYLLYLENLLWFSLMNTTCYSVKQSIYQIQWECPESLYLMLPSCHITRDPDEHGFHGRKTLRISQKEMHVVSSEVKSCKTYKRHPG